MKNSDIFDALPIAAFLPEVDQHLSTANTLVLQAEPGAGKSTALPFSLLGAAWLKHKKIIMLEPRRVAAKSIAHFLAQSLGEKVGQRIGYQVKNERKISADTQLEIITEGILTRRLQNDPEINDVALIIFDEFHERSLHADLALLLALEIQQSIRDDLKLLVMSATIDTQLMTSYLGGAKLIACPGRGYPVEVQYTRNNTSSIHQKVLAALSDLLKSNDTGDILVFLAGQADINRCISMAKQTWPTDDHTLFLALYGSLAIEQQEHALRLDPNGLRRVIFTTNIAETSLTIAGITHVIDSGFEKIYQYNPASGLSQLNTQRISKASAEQRKGRAGRTQAGHCIRLWNEQTQHSLNDFQREEILSADITPLALELIHWGQSDFESIAWLTPPPRHHYSSAISLLQQLKLIDEHNKITPLGTRAVNLPLTPRLASMILQTQSEHEKILSIQIALLISESNIFTQQSADIAQRLIAIQDYIINKKDALKHHPLKHTAIKSLMTSCHLLQKQLKVKPPTSAFTLDKIHKLTGKILLHAYPERLAIRRSEKCGRYLMANKKGATLMEGDSLFGSQWLVISNCDAKNKEARIFSAVSIDEDIVIHCLQDALIEEDHYEYDLKKKKVIGRQRLQYGAITLKTAIIAKIPKKAFIQCIKPVLVSEGLSLLNWTDKCQQWLSRATWLGEHIEDFPVITENSLLSDVETWLFPYTQNINSIEQLKKINIIDLLTAQLSWDQQQLLNKEAPSHYNCPTNKKVPIIYDPVKGPTISVILQEVFGVLESPKLALGKVSLRFELLSPGRKPIQTTSDIGNFWKTSYFDVIKDMKGRYPKHRWPDQPLLEKAGKSYKPRT